MKIISKRGVALSALTIFGLSMMPAINGGSAEAKPNKNSRSSSHSRSTPPGWSKGKKTGWSKNHPSRNRSTNTRYNTRYKTRTNTPYRSGTSGRTLIGSKYYSTRAGAENAVTWARNRGYYATMTYDSARRMWLVRSYR